MIPILLGSVGSETTLLNPVYEGEFIGGSRPKPELASKALLYLNAPLLSGGKTPFDIDGGGLTQMFYRINGQRLLRTASAQAILWQSLSFIEEASRETLPLLTTTRVSQTMWISSCKITTSSRPVIK